ncbi:MAG: hypothetical protein DWQ31_17355 [Planctomycetota bacterium]|nr:MAG: hypothetical protein DWQ31_17355 [Planctomycetota bacterium]REJ92119.1 MAG: hypothetical protein DWQ35_13305 [Planctomycetota bacterium]REK28655.1 MAG: hypothetical protein DWQ42_04895 [Planctomycetota bacterium]REK39269.1 MAG: hypothetical protein DWQ46_18475 [Planctomycetota bacterium]
MLRIATSHLLFAIVLMSPYLCLGEAAGAISAPHQGGGCSCAKHNHESGGETPQPSDENEPDCLCRGAIMDGVRSTELDSSMPLTVVWLIDDAVLAPTAISLADTSSEPPHQFPPFSTGWDICVLTCALLL